MTTTKAIELPLTTDTEDAIALMLESVDNAVLDELFCAVQDAAIAEHATLSAAEAIAEIDTARIGKAASEVSNRRRRERLAVVRDRTTKLDAIAELVAGIIEERAQ